jgi:hypothetical protein
MLFSIPRNQSVMKAPILPAWGSTSRLERNRNAGTKESIFYAS